MGQQTFSEKQLKKKYDVFIFCAMLAMILPLIPWALQLACRTLWSLLDEGVSLVNTIPTSSREISGPSVSV